MLYTMFCHPEFDYLGSWMLSGTTGSVFASGLGGHGFRSQSQSGDLYIYN